MNKHTAITQSQSHFASAVHANIGRSTFWRNSTRKTTFNAGYLVPVYCDEVLPGDTFEMTLRHVTRLTTPIVPTMDVLYLDFYAFFVPNRLVWDGWEELHGENKTGAWAPATPPPLVPFYGANPPGQTVLAGSIGDYYGLPVGANYYNMGGCSSLPFRGYGLTRNEWFRDQNLEAPIPINKSNTITWGEEYQPYNNLLKVNRMHDFFSSCLPAPQKGESALIPIELNELIPIITGADTPYNQGSTLLRFRHVDHPTDIIPSQGVLGVGLGANTATFVNPTVSGSSRGVQPSNLWADGRAMQLNTTTIHELRTAFQIQKLYERDARGGTRYIEMLKAHFGVDAQDYRLQRPELLGHMRTTVGMQQVPQTSATQSGSPQGNLAAYSYTSDDRLLFKKSFVEHGFIHIFAVARHPKTYQQGVEKMFSRRDRLDFYYPALAHISEQPVYNKEIYASGSLEENSEVFGYNEAWAQYRYKPNSVTGQFRNINPVSLGQWHYADWYPSRPYLSADWIKDNSDINVDRTLALQAYDDDGNPLPGKYDQIMSDIAFICKATRPMPTYSVPGFVDHF